MFTGLGVVFLLLVIIVFSLFVLTPTGAVHISGSYSVLVPLGGALGLIMVGLGLYQRRNERGSSSPRR